MAEHKDKKTADMKTYMKEYMTHYRKSNPERLKKRVTCAVCNVTYYKVNKSHHERSAKHVLEDQKRTIEELKSNRPVHVCEKIEIDPKTLDDLTIQLKNCQKLLDMMKKNAL